MLLLNSFPFSSQVILLFDVLTGKALGEGKPLTHKVSSEVRFFFPSVNFNFNFVLLTMTSMILKTETLYIPIILTSSYYLLILK